MHRLLIVVLVRPHHETARRYPHQLDPDAVRHIAWLRVGMHYRFDAWGRHRKPRGWRRFLRRGRCTFNGALALKLFSLSCALRFLLSGKKPFQRDNKLINIMLPAPVAEFKG